MKTKPFVLGVCAIAMMCSGPSAQAAIAIVSLLGGGPNLTSDTNYVTFDSLALGGTGGPAANTAGSANPLGSIAVSFSPDARVVIGPVVSGVYAPPYLSGTNGTKFGQSPGEDTTKYITSGSYGAVSNSAAILGFSSPQKYFGILWGSVDDYNTLTFYSGATLLGATFVGSVTGSQVSASPNGDQGVNGTRYVNLNSDLSFNWVVATSSQYAFEFDNVAYSEVLAIPAVVPGDVPEPTSLVAWSLLGLTITGGSWWRRRKATA